MCIEEVVTRFRLYHANLLAFKQCGAGVIYNAVVLGKPALTKSPTLIFR